MSAEISILTEPAVRIVIGDCLVQLGALAAESVHCVITSPPYWGLRDYGIAPSVWPDGSVCCFGLEPTPELYVQHAVAIFRAVWRVLRPDGTLWVNLGDSYATQSSGAPQSGMKALAEKYRPGSVRKNHAYQDSDAIYAARTVPAGFKAGDLVGMPWRVALALQADGWYLRRDNIWAKGSCMPESVNGVRWEQHRVKAGTVAPDWQARPKGWQGGRGAHDKVTKGNYRTQGDATQEVAQYIDCLGCETCAPHGGLVLRRGNWRATTSHEYLFQFSKSARYFCDPMEAQEAAAGTAHARGHGVNPKSHAGARAGSRMNSSFSAAVSQIVPTRNRRSVWRVNPKPFKGAHFATFPPGLIEPIVRIATAPAVCARCGAPHAPVVRRGPADRAHQVACGADAQGGYTGQATKDFATAGAQDASATKARILAGMVEKRVVGYRPTCRCGAAAGTARAVVLDPFAGSGTTLAVARELGRDAIGIDIAPHYEPLMRARLEGAKPAPRTKAKAERKKAA